MIEREPCNVRMLVLMTPTQRAMLEDLAQWQHRSMAGVVRTAIERVHAVTIAARGQASGKGGALAHTSKEWPR